MSAPLRVLHLTTDAGGISGAERILIGLGQFADIGAVALSFATVRPEGPLTSALAATGWPVHSLSVEHARNVPRGVLQLTGIIRRERIDIVHTHLTHASIFGAAATILAQNTLVQTRHYTDAVVRYADATTRRLDRWAARRCSAIAAVSDAACAHLVTAEGIARARVTVIGNGVDWETLAASDAANGRALLRAAGVGSGLIVGCAATFHPRKGHRTLIDAFARIAVNAANTELVLLGRGPEQPLIEKQVKRLGLTRRVHFLGHRDDAYDLIAAFDVYTQPSVEEGFGLAVLEAMALARPLVVSDVGGMVETVTPDAGIRVPPSDPEALACALAKLLGDAALRKSMGEHGVARVRHEYAMKRMVTRYENWYRTIGT